MRWFGERAIQIGREHPGKYICVAGEELFVGDDPKEVYDRANRAHPEDAGTTYTRYIRPMPGVAADAS